MVLLLALLLAFLAQNLITPWPLNFVGVCVVSVVLGVWHFAFQRAQTFVLTPPQVWLTAALVTSLIVLWQFFPASTAALVLMGLACVLFVYVTRDDDEQLLASSGGHTPQSSSPLEDIPPNPTPHSIRSPIFNAIPSFKGTKALLHYLQSSILKHRFAVFNPLHAVIIAAIMFVSLIVNTYNNERIQPGLHGDEAESGLEARNINAGRYATLIGIGWYDQPLPSFLVQAWGLRLFGDTVSGLRTSSAVVGVLTLPLVYLLARSLFGAPVGLLTMVLMACAHWFIAYAHLGINYNQTTFLEVVAVWTFWEGYRRRRWHWFILSGLATGAGLYLYFASRLVPILLAAFAMSRWQMADSAWQIAHGCWQTVGSLTQRFPRFTFHVSRFAFHVSRLSPLVSRLSSLVSRFTLHVSRHSPRFAAIRYPPFVHSLKGTLRRATRPSPILPMRYFVLWLAVTLLVFAPMGVFFAAHLKELSSRADFVFLFNDPVKVKDYTGTTDYPSALFVQTYRYAALFNAGSDRSGQYGNQAPLLDYYTAVFFVLGLAYALARWREPRFTLLLLWIALTIFIGGVLTIESPFTPRIVGLMPVPFMLAALALVRLWRVWQNVPLRGCANSEMSLLGDARIANGEWQIANSERPMAVDAARHPRISLRGHSAISHLLSASRITNYQLLMQKWLPRFVVLALLVAIAYNNAWLYFERYLNTLEGWAQREIATTVARYATTLQADQTLYVLGAPELFVWHGTIKFLAPNLRGDDILNPDSDLPIRDPLTRRASFVVAPSYLLWLEKLQQVYPNGQIKEFRRPWGELWFIIYEVSAEEIEKKRP